MTTMNLDRAYHQWCDQHRMMHGPCPEPQEPVYTAAQIIAIGGSDWTGRAGQRRVYLKDWPEMVGLDVSYYRTGNVSGASLNGEKISNNRATRLLCAKVWWEDGVIRTTLAAVQEDARVACDLVGALGAEIARRVAEVGMASG